MPAVDAGGIMTPFWKLSAAGFAATAITYGPARMGFGLFLPEFRSVFSISIQEAGMISSLGFFGFFAGLLVSQAMTAASGPRLPIVFGLAAATAGIGLVASAPSLPMLSLGILLAMSSAGFSWTPFSDAINHGVEERLRPTALSLVSTGTGLGITAAGTAALLMSIGGVSWRLCWAIFAIGSALSLLGNWMALRGAAGRPGPRRALRWRVLFHRAAIPLFGIGFCFGITSTVYISFAADRIAQAGGVPGIPVNVSGSLVFICYGAFGLLGLVTGSAKVALGLPLLLRLLMLASALSSALIALVPTSWTGVVVSAGLQGINVMMMSAAMAFWSDRLFPDFPSRGFTAVLLAVATGSVLGPVAAGSVADAFGAVAMFLGTATLAAVAALAIRSGYIRESPHPG
ncbi:MFS transporter [Parvibaculum sp.]|uniref:MFS transporter n=1 Tax=Parvibaculum sp. TaxID=2024848 RepID=UPI0025CD9397|nr:MFS transporter [Parvibaculum sp.]